MSYSGGKGLTRRAILPLLQQFTDCEYREPFAGGAVVGLNYFKATRRSGWLNDLDPAVTALWLAVRDDPDELQAKVRAFRPSLAVFDDVKAYFLTRPILPTHPNAIVEMALRKLALQQLSFSGRGAVGHVRGARSQAFLKLPQYWNADAICKRLAEAHRILQGVRITNHDFETLIADELPAILFCDSPYWRVDGDPMYQYSFNYDDHVRLRDMLQQTPHEWIMTNADLPLTWSLYRWAHIERIPVLYSMAGTGRRTHELLIMKRDCRR